MNKYNSEHYYDPTPYEALSIIEQEEKKWRYRPLVFICSPLAGDMERNIQNACRYSKFAVENGAIPFAPHIHYTRFMDDRDPVQRELALFFGIVLLGKCDELWVFGGRISPGMEKELAKARRRGKPIRYFNDQCEEVTPYA